MKHAKKIISLIVLTLLILASAEAIAGNKPEGELKVKKQDFSNSGKKLFVEDQIIVKYKNDGKPFRVVDLPIGISVEEAVVDYQKKPNVEFAEPNYLAYADYVPNDWLYNPYQWHMDNSSGSGINSEEAWDIARGSGVTVAVIDTGLKLGGNDTPKCIVDGYDFINIDADPSDDNGHGTHVSGTIAQNTNNEIGAAGVAYEACIMPVKALDGAGSGSYSAIASAIYFAVDHGADVINMSLGGTASDTTLATAVRYAYDNGVTVVAAAGNSSTNLPHYPSSYETVISVGATGYDKSLASYSNYGPTVDLVAPGGDMYYTVYNRAGKIVSQTMKDLNGDYYPDGVLQETFDTEGFKFFFYQGTSMASPHVAGAAALLLSLDQTLSPDAIRELLTRSAQDLGATGRDDIFGYGLIDAYAALNRLINPPVVVDVDSDNYDASIDCDDNNALIFPGAVEICGNGVDEDCDGYDKACPVCGNKICETGETRKNCPSDCRK